VNLPDTVMKVQSEHLPQQFKRPVNTMYTCIPLSTFYLLFH